MDVVEEIVNQMWSGLAISWEESQTISANKLLVKLRLEGAVEVDLERLGTDLRKESSRQQQQQQRQR